MSVTEQIIKQIEKGEMELIPTLTQQAIEQDTSDELMALLETLYQVGFNEEMYSIAEYLNNQQEDDELKIILAEISFEDGDDLTGIDWLQKINKDSSTYPQALLVMADYYQANGLPEVSEQKLIEAEKLLPNEPIIQFALAELYYYMQEINEALNHYNLLIEEGIEEVAGISIKGRIASIKGRFGEIEDSEQTFKQLLEEQPHIDNYFQLGFLYFQQGDYQKAEAEFKEVLALDPNYWAVYPLLVQIYLANSELDKALEAANLGIQRDELNEELWSLRAQIYVQRDELEKASHDYQHAIECSPEHEELYLNYIEFLNENEDYEAIISLISQAPESIQKSSEIIWKLAQAYEFVEEFEQAHKYFVQAAGTLLEHEEFLLDYFAFLVDEGNFERAKLVGKKYLQMNPNDYEFEERLLRIQNER